MRDAGQIAEVACFTGCLDLRFVVAVFTNGHPCLNKRLISAHLRFDRDDAAGRIAEQRRCRSAQDFYSVDGAKVDQVHAALTVSQRCRNAVHQNTNTANTKTGAGSETPA